MGSLTMSSELPAPQVPFHVTEELLPALLGKLVRLVQERYIDTDADMDKTIEKAVDEVIKDAKENNNYEQLQTEGEKAVSGANKTDAKREPDGKLSKEKIDKTSNANEDLKAGKAKKENGKKKELEANKEKGEIKKDDEATKEEETKKTQEEAA